MNFMFHHKFTPCWCSGWCSNSAL